MACRAVHTRHAPPASEALPARAHHGEALQERAARGKTPSPPPPGPALPESERVCVRAHATSLH
eukprot:1972905-Rhodomonas_salina.1